MKNECMLMAGLPPDGAFPVAAGMVPNAFTFELLTAGGAAGDDDKVASLSLTLPKLTAASRAD